MNLSNTTNSPLVSKRRQGTGKEENDMYYANACNLLKPFAIWQRVDPAHDEEEE